MNLPEPDEWGNYWFAGISKSPCILHSRIKGRYIASGKDGLPLTEDSGLRRFDSPEEALRFMEARGT